MYCMERRVYKMPADIGRMEKDHTLRQSEVKINYLSCLETINSFSKLIYVTYKMYFMLVLQNKSY